MNYIFVVYHVVPRPQEGVRFRHAKGLCFSPYSQVSTPNLRRRMRSMGLLHWDLGVSTGLDPRKGVYEGVEFHPLPIPPRGGPFTPGLFGSWTPAYVHEAPGVRLVGVILLVSSANVNTNHANFGPQYRRDVALLLYLLYGHKDASPRILSKCS